MMRLERIAAARARNLAPWGELRVLAGGKRQVSMGTDARIHDIGKAALADPKATARLLLSVAWNDLRVVWHTLMLVVRLWYGR